MNLAQALRKKNVLKGEVARLRLRIQQQNCIQEPQKPVYDNNQLMEELSQKTNKLIDLKTQIAALNVEINALIFRQAELKGLIEMLNVMPVTEGKMMKENFEGKPYEVTYTSQIGVAKRDALVAKSEQEIQAIEAKLAEYNVTHRVNFSE